MNKDERAALGPEIRTTRERLGLTQVELAGAAEVNPRTLRNIETGQTVGQADVIHRIKGALNRFSHVQHKNAVSDLNAIQTRFGDRAAQYYDDHEALNTALLALVEMQTNLLRDDFEAVRANTADFFLPTFFILSDLATKAGSSPLTWVPAMNEHTVEEVTNLAAAAPRNNSGEQTDEDGEA